MDTALLVKRVAWIVLAAASATAFAERFPREGDAFDPAMQPDAKPYTWPDEPPANCPHPRSTSVQGLRFTGRYANYTGADTWYPTWAADGNLYSAWTDGYVWTTREVAPYECPFCDVAWKNLGREPSWGAGKLKPYHCHSNTGPMGIGLAKIVGDSPYNLRVEPLGRLHTGQDLYPCATAVAEGTFFVGTYRAFDDGGRFNGFRYSRDWDHWVERDTPGWKDQRWIDPRDSGTDFFSTDTRPRRFNVPHAVVHGQDNEQSPDGKLYLTAHGQAVVDGGAKTKSDWDKGDAIYLCRVDPAPTRVTDPKAYEFFAGHDADGVARWSADVRDSQPILAWPRHLGSECATYVPGLDRYLLLTARLREREDNLSYNTLSVWESSEITGPYRLVTYLRDWGPQTYFPNVPAKFIAADGRRMWLCVASNYASTQATPPQCRYAMSLHEFDLILPGDAPPPASPAQVNVAPSAKVVTATAAPPTSAEALVDGNAAGKGAEWGAADRRLVWVEFRWDEPQRVSAVRLWDRADVSNWVRAAKLTFDDGSTELQGAWLSNTSRAPGHVEFPEKVVRRLRIEASESDGPHPGFAEVEVLAPR